MPRVALLGTTPGDVEAVEMYGRHIQKFRSANIRINLSSTRDGTYLSVEERAYPEFHPHIRHASVSGEFDEDIEVDRLIHMQSASAHFYWVRREKAGGRNKDELRNTKPEDKVPYLVNSLCSTSTTRKNIVTH